MTVDAPPRPAPALRRSLGSGSTTPERLFRVALVLSSGAWRRRWSACSPGAAQRLGREAQTRIAALTADSAELYRSLADADAMATSGYVSGGREPTAVRARYDDDIARATDRLVSAAGRLPDSEPVAHDRGTAARLHRPRGDPRARSTAEGLPLGQSYLGSASELMRGTILPAAEELRRQQAAALTEAYARGVAIPFAVGALLLATLVAIVDVSLRERRRTHRTLSVGLLTAAVALVAALAWWVAAVGVANGRLDDRAAAQRRRDRARRRAHRVLQARSAESLALVARSAGFAADDDFTNGIVGVVGADGASGLLGRADGGAPGSADRITALRVAVGDWQAAHRQVRDLDDGGRYTDAVASVVTTTPGGSGAAFERLDAAFGEAIDAERAAFADATASAASALTGLVAGPAVLALLAAAAVAVGLGRRIGEYR